MAIAEALIGGGIKLLGGIFGNRSAKKQRAQALEDQREQFVRLRDAAEAAGFNPLTALQAAPTGGLVNPTPALASGSFIADALGAGVDTYFNAKQRQRDVERDLLEKSLMRQELQNMQMQGKALEKSMRFGFEIPQAKNYTGVSKTSPSLAEREIPERDSYNLYVDVYDPTTKRWMTIPNPDLMDAGPMEMATGLATIGAADAAQNGVPKVGGFLSAGPRKPREKATPVWSDYENW